MGLDVVPVPALKDNYVYLLRDRETGATAAVDPGDAAPAIEALEKQGWAPLSIVLCTHHHWDHVNGNLALAERYGCEIACSRYDFDRARVPGATRAIGDRDRIELGNSSFVGVSIPGHTLGHIAYWSQTDAAAFCGDTLFAFGAGRLFEGTADQLKASLAKIAALPSTTRVYYGHEYAARNAEFALSLARDEATEKRFAEIQANLARGEFATPGLLADELATNPFFRVDDAAYRERAGLGSFTASHAFAELRARRDRW